MAIAIGYYVAAWLGLVLRFPPATTPVMWPANALLTAILLLAPRRRWALGLAAVFPAHLLAEIPAGLPPALVVARFFTNCLEAVLAATLVRRWSDAPTRLDSIPRVTAFLAGAVVLAPLASCLAYGAVVSGLQGEPFGLVALGRALSSAVAVLTVVPWTLAAARTANWRRATRRRRLEASSLAALLLGLGLVVFSGHIVAWPGLPGIPYTSLVFVVLVLLWATVRFGAGGASLALLALSLMASGAAALGWTPSAPLQGELGARSLQVFVLVMGVPLLLLAALIDERRHANLALEGRLSFEGLLARLSGTFASVSPAESARVFDASLARLGRFVGADRTALHTFGPDGQLPIAHTWAPSPAAPLPNVSLPWLTEQLRRTRTIAIAGPDELPRDAGAEHEFVRALGARALLMTPLVADGLVLGGLCFAYAAGRGWPEVLQERGRLVADVFAGAMARRQAGEALRVSEAAKSAMLESRRSAEAEARKSRQELAHLLRVSTLGELTTSLAHELNQPLTAILANAQTALRMLADGTELDRLELRSMMRDIVEDDRRAGEVIRRQRDLLRKGETERVALDANALVHEVIGLVSSDAVLRAVGLRARLHPTPLWFEGDRVQVEQVLLNLLINAMEAAGARGAHPRVSVRTGPSDGAILVAISDAGPGLPGERPDIVFEPFYTTKPAGLGMGLSIARSIVRAHGGSIEARNNPDRGATFTVSLPAWPAAAATG
jgi:signal transduction histidine kinase